MERAEVAAPPGHHRGYQRRQGIDDAFHVDGDDLGAAGGVEAVITVLAIHHQVSPPTTNIVTPDPACDLDYVPNTSRRANVDITMSNSMGFGGHNASLIFRKGDLS